MRGVDPDGKRALFEAPIAAPPEQLRAGRAPEGREALFSAAGPPVPGTVVVTCSACEARSRVGWGDLGLRLITGSLLVPGRQRDWLVRCPACDTRTWCSIAFRG